MLIPVAKLRARWRLCAAVAATPVTLLAVPHMVDAQIVQGVEQGAREGNKAAGPVGGVLGGAIGGVVGVVTGVTGVLTGNNGNPNAGNSKNAQAPASGDKQGAKAAKSAKAAAKDKGAKQAPTVLTQAGAPQLTAEQIVANSDANIERIKKELNLTPEQEKNWAGTISATMARTGSTCALHARSEIRLTTSSSRCATRPSSSTIARSISAAWRTPPSRCLRASTTSRSKSSSTKWFASATSAGSTKREVGTNSRATMPWGRLKAQHPAILPQRRGPVNSSFNVEEKPTGSRPSDGRVRALSGTAFAMGNIGRRFASAIC